MAQNEADTEMTREQIEKAALQCAKDRWGDSESQHAMAKAQGTVYGFKQGAQWRINSVWHNSKEEPDKRKEILAEFRFMTPDGEIVSRREIVESLDDLCDSHCDVLNWAYLDDLMYNKEEAECGHVSYV